MVKSLKQLVVEMDCPVLVLGQLGRILRGDKRLVLEDIDSYDVMKSFLDYIVLMNIGKNIIRKIPQEKILQTCISRKMVFCHFNR